MKIIQRGPTDADLSQRIQNEKVAGEVRRNIAPKTEQTGASSTVNISKEARELQKITELARTGDELRANKVKQLKEQIANGTYHSNPQEISKSIIRSEVSRLLKDE
jgi:flagellar biosynthesis anti-sigma factor FlgM